MNSINSPKLAVVTKENNFRDLVYAEDTPLPQGEVVLSLSGEVFERPGRETIQIGLNRHIFDPLGQFINHSCHPSCKIEGNLVIGLKEIKPGDSITFDYNRSEDRMAYPFICDCCHKLIAGILVTKK